MILYHRWISLSLATRQRIAEKFGILKKSSIEVVNNTVKADGFHIEDIENAITVPTMQNFLKSEETDSAVLWEMLVNRIEGKEPIIPIPNIDTTAQKVEPTLNAPIPPANPPSPAKKFGRPKGSKRINGVWVYPNN